MNDKHYALYLEYGATQHWYGVLKGHGIRTYKTEKNAIRAANDLVSGGLKKIYVVDLSSDHFLSPKVVVEVIKGVN